MVGTISGVIGGLGKSIVRDSLAAYFDASYSQSYPGTGSTWSDMSGNGVDGTLTGGYTFSNNNSFLFNGTTGYFPYSVSNTLAMSIITVARAPASTWNNFGLLGSSRATVNGWIIHSESGAATVTMYLYNSTGGGVTAVGTITTATITDINMYTLTTNGSNSHKRYLNGSLIGTNTTAITRSATPTTASVQLAKDLTFARYFNGYIYFHAVYNKELSQEEISQNYYALGRQLGF